MISGTDQIKAQKYIYKKHFIQLYKGLNRLKIIKKEIMKHSEFPWLYAPKPNIIKYKMKHKYNSKNKHQ